MKLVKNIATNASALTISRIVGQILSAFASILLVRYLGTTKLGEFSFVYTYLSFFTILSSFGIDNIIIREISQDKEKAGVFIGNALVLRLVFSVFSILLSWLFLRILKCPLNTTILVYLASLEMLLSFKSIYSLVFNIELKLYYQAVIQISSGLIDALLTIIFIWLKGDLIIFILISIFVALCELLANRYFSRKLIKPIFSINLNIWRYLVKEGWPLGLTYFFVIIYFRIDQIMIYKLAGVNLLGLYSVSVKITEYLHIIPDSFMVSIFPVMAAQFNSDKEYFRRVYFLSAKYLLMLVWPMATFLSFYSEKIFSLLFGQEFISSAYTFSILIWSLVFVFTGALGNKVIISIGRQKIDA